MTHRIMKSIISAFLLTVLSVGCSLTVAAAEEKENVEQWRIYSETNAKNLGLKALLYSFDGEDGVLGIRCQNRQPELYFMLSDRLSARIDSALSMKVDGTILNGIKWSRASGGNGAFAITPLSVINQLENKQSLILTYQTEQGKYKVTAFYLVGIDRVKQKLTSACNIVA